MLLYLITLILATGETWVIIEANKADRESNKIGCGPKKIIISGLWDSLHEVIIAVTGILIYVENKWLSISAVLGVFLGNVLNKGWNQYKFKKQQFKPKEDDDEGDV